MLLGEAVGYLVTGDIDADQWIEGGGTITETHRCAVPKRILVLAAVVHTHDQLEGQRLRPDV